MYSKILVRSKCTVTYFLYKFYPDAMSGSVMATLASCIACNICHCEHVLADC